MKDMSSVAGKGTASTSCAAASSTARWLNLQSTHAYSNISSRCSRPSPKTKEEAFSEAAHSQLGVVACPAPKRCSKMRRSIST